MKKLKGFQKKYLKGLAHSLKPIVFVGQKGDSDSVVQATEAALNQHELIKVKFIDFKEKELKRNIIASLEQKTVCEVVGVIGHMAIMYRQHRDPEKRKITLPKR